MSNITISKFDYTGVVGKALLECITGVKGHCAQYDSFGLCDIMECLYCENCYYKITMENGESISNCDVDLSTVDNHSNGMENDNYEVLFYDYVPDIDSLFNYLFDEKSQFKILRTSDNMIMNNQVKFSKKLIKEKQ